MKYGIQKGYGEYTFEGRAVTVVSFGSSSSLRAWIDERPTARCEISSKQYVQTYTGRNASVRAVAISPDELNRAGETEQQQRRLELESEADGDYHKS